MSRVLLTESSNCGFDIGLSGQPANSASHFFDLGTAEALLIRPRISPDASAHRSVLGLSSYRAANTHNGQRQHQRADRLQVTVGRVQQKGDKSPQLLELFHPHPAVATQR